MEAELIWAHILDFNMNDKLLMNKYRRLLNHYNRLHSLLSDAVKMETRKNVLDLWEHILKHLKLGGDVLADLAEFGGITDRGKKAAFERMRSIKETQSGLKLSEELINKNQAIYEKHWLEHPRLVFEITKAFLHELPALITYRGNALAARNPETPPICHCLIRHFAFTRELAYQDLDLYLTLKDTGKLIEKKRHCLGPKCKFYEGDEKGNEQHMFYHPPQPNS